MVFFSDIYHITVSLEEDLETTIGIMCLMVIVIIFFLYVVLVIKIGENGYLTAA